MGRTHNPDRYGTNGAAGRRRFRRALRAEYHDLDHQRAEWTAHEGELRADVEAAKAGDRKAALRLRAAALLWQPELSASIPASDEVRAGYREHAARKAEILRGAGYLARTESP